MSNLSIFPNWTMYLGMLLHIQSTLFHSFHRFKKNSLCSLILNPHLCIIILPFNRTMITVKVDSKVISDIVGSCCRSISLLCKILKGIIMYFSPIIHNISMDFIIWQCQDIWGTTVALTTVVTLSGFK